MCNIRKSTLRIALCIKHKLPLILLILTIILVGIQAAFAAGGSYTIKWYSADPAINRAPYLPTYTRMSPARWLNERGPFPIGKAADPLQYAVAYGPTFSTSDLDAVTSLAPKDMALSQIVPFEVEIKVSGSTAPENGAIQFTGGWSTKTTSGANFGYDPGWMLFAAFVDTADPGTIDPDGNAKVDAFSSTLANPGANSEEIQGTIKVSGLESGDNIIVEAWVALKPTIPSGSTGNVQTRLINANTIHTPPDTINTGNQTVPLLRVQEFFSSTVDVSIIKKDSPDPVFLGQQLTYTITVTNNSATTVANGVTVTDTLDPNVQFVSASDGGVFNGVNIVTWNIGFLSPLQAKSVTLAVAVLSKAPTEGTKDLTNSVTVASITTDSNSANNSYTEYTDALKPNKLPIAKNDAVTVEEDSVKNHINVLANDDPGDAPATITSVTTPANGTAVINNNGTPGDPSDDYIEYTPNANFCGSDSFNYTITGSNGDKSTATVSVTVNCVNDAPVANTDYATTSEDTPVTINVAANDFDVDGNLLPGSTTVVSGPSHGTLVNNGDGTFTYTPGANFSGSDSFVYQICDADGLCDTATVNITVTPVNDPPVAVDDNVSTDEDKSVTISVVTNDFDVDGNLVPGSATVVSGPSYGTLVNNGDGTFTYTPNPDFNGSDSFVYQICDTDGLCDTATVNITVSPVNDPPVAVDDYTTTPENMPVTINVAANDFDVDGNLVPGSAILISGPSHGKLVNNGDGTFTYTPDPNFNGADSFVYQICDTGGLCDTATVNIVVASENDPPAAYDDSAATLEDTQVTINVATNDFDVDGNLDPTSAKAIFGPSHGTLFNNGDGTFTYTPNPDFNGSDSFVYQICDTDGLCDTATVNITVTPVNDPPVAVDDNVSTDEDKSVTISVVTNDFDVDGNLVPDSAMLVSDPSHGTLVNNGDGTFTYTPNPDFNGSDGFVYQVCDTDGLCDTATVNITVSPVNDPPLAVDDSVITDEDSSVTISVAANDLDVDGNLDPASVIAISGPSHGTLVNNGDGTFNYTPDPNFNGADSFVYQVCDTGGLCSIATVDIIVNPINDPPAALDNYYSTDEDTPLIVPAPGVLGNDVDMDGDSLIIKSYDDFSANGGSISMNPDGSFTYTPALNYNGTDRFTYEVCDPSGACVVATVYVAVAAENDPPVAYDDYATTPEDTPIIINVLVNDFDMDGNLDPTSATVMYDPSRGTLTSNGDGTFTYTPNPDFNGSDIFVYQICDTDGLCDTAKVTIMVTPVSDLPVAMDDAYSTPEDMPITVSVALNDTDVDGNLDPTSATVVSETSHGTLGNNGDGTFTYTPDLNFNGTDSFEYQICDTDGLCDTATVTITVTPVNDPPIAHDDYAFTSEDVPVTIDVAGNDFDVDDNLDPPSAVAISDPSYGTLTNNGDGTFTYTPNANFYGVDSFVYRVCDTDGLCDVATVTITVTPENDPPVAKDDAYSTSEDISLVIPSPGVLGNDTDVDGDALLVNLLTVPMYGMLAQNPDGSFTYIPNENYYGEDSYTYKACDPGGLCDEATVYITVNSVNDPPVAVSYNATTLEDTPVDIDVASNDFDVDRNLDPASAAVVSAPSHGTLTNNGDGTFTYTPNPDFYGTDSFIYQICDTEGLCSIATVTIIMTPVNDPPVAMDYSTSTDEDTPVKIDAAINDTDVDSHLDPSTATVVSEPSHGTLVNNGDGTFTYTPNPDFNGTDSFVYQICDPEGLCDTSTVTIIVVPVNDPPVAVDDSVSTGEDAPVTIDVASNDFDVDGNLDSSSATVVSEPSHGTLVNNGDGTFTYTPNLDFNGIDRFEYQICDTGSDSDEALCATAKVTIAVASENDPPMAADDSATTDEDTPVTIDVATNDSDVDGNLDPSSAVVIYGPYHGTLINNGDGTFTYTPGPNFSGTDSFIYRICDTGLDGDATTDGDDLCDTATVAITVTPVNDAPVAVDDYTAIPEDTPVTINVVVNDFDVDGNLDASSATVVSGPSHGTLVNNGDGTFTYAPDPDFNGNDSFVYKICDEDGLCAEATANITVTPVNDPPVAVDDNVSTPEDDPVDFNVAANDSDVDGNLDVSSVISVYGPFHGTLFDEGNGKFIYTPDPDFYGADSFVYRICDTGQDNDATTDGDDLCVTATVNITVTPVNDPPVANDNSATVDEGAYVVINVTSNDTDVDGFIVLSTLTITTQPANGTVSINTVTGEITYTPNVGFSGNDTFVYQVCDDAGLCDTAMVNVTVRDVNPTLVLLKSAEPLRRLEPGGDFKFTLTIVNTSVEPIKIISLSDTNGSPIPTECKGLVGQWIPVGSLITCQYVVKHTNAGSYSNSAEVTAVDNEGNMALANASATVEVTNANPLVKVIKEVDANGDGVFNDISESIPERKSTKVTFRITIRNDSASSDPITISSITDSLWYDLDGNRQVGEGEITSLNIIKDSDQLSTTWDDVLKKLGLNPDKDWPTLASGNSLTFEYTVLIEGQPFVDPIDTVVVKAVDDDAGSSPALASDDARVDILTVNQRSIQIESITSNAAGKAVEVRGQFVITDQSEAPNENLLYVQVTNYQIDFEYKSTKKYEPTDFENNTFFANGKPIWYECSYFVVKRDGVVYSPALPLGGNPVIFGQNITIGYTCKLNSPLPQTGTLRLTASAQILDRLDRTFIYRQDFSLSAGVVSAAPEIPSALPGVTRLRPNYPNPFNPDTWIPFELAQDASVRIEIYAVTGQLVRTLELGYRPAGYYLGRARAAYWDGRNEAGESVASGIYFYRLVAGRVSMIRRMVILK